MSALDRKVEIDILRVLSDFIPRNQNEVTRAMGKSEKKSTDRVKVHRAIRRTAKYYARSMPKMNDTGKLWVLRKELGIIGQIVTDYPELFTHFQSNDIVLSMLVDKHVNRVCTGGVLSELQELDFKHRLKTSATFFRLYLFESPEDLLDIIETLFSITGQELERPFSDLLDVTFRACVGADILITKMKTPLAFNDNNQVTKRVDSGLIP